MDESSLCIRRVEKVEIPFVGRVLSLRHLALKRNRRTMPSYIATYDLVGTNVKSEEYAALIDAIGQYPAREVQKSVWVLRTSQTAMEVFVHPLGLHAP